MVPRRRKIRKNSLPHFKHLKFLENAEKVAMLAFEVISLKMVEAIEKELKKKKLIKSEDMTIGAINKKNVTFSQRLAKNDDFPSEKILKGWSGEVPKIEVDLNALASKAIDKYLDAIKYIFLGDFAGEDAKNSIIDLGLKGKILPGTIYGTYLQAIDTQREFYSAIYGVTAPKINMDTLKFSFDFVQNHTARYVDQSLLIYKNKILEALSQQIASRNNENTIQVQERAHEITQEIGEITAKRDIIRMAIGDVVEKKLSLVEAKQVLKDVVKDYSTDLERIVKTELSMASSAGTHQAIVNIFGAQDSELRVVFMTTRRENVCDFCHNQSYNADGSFKFYRMIDFAPSGANVNRSKKNWVLSIPPLHPRCHCLLIYIPKGMSIDKMGNLVLEK